MLIGEAVVITTKLYWFWDLVQGEKHIVCYMHTCVDNLAQ